ncbi:MAG TPA: DUF1573 domain-containing protein [Chitinophagaceae bacterium]|jgi:hypothetical protein|nr:DUF1573 domain-containing protein [Chitinophagaceae bacterium]
MKKSILLFSACILFGFASNAQTPTNKPANGATQVVDPHAGHDHGTPAAAPQQAAVPAQNADLSMKFTTEDHNFGNIPEGPSVSYDFEFKNIGKEPIILSNVQASCGCTTPTWPKEPIAPGKSAKITATYSTQGRPGQFTKTVTVTSNVGSKVLKIGGVVEKAPDSSVPSNNSSIMKH